MTYGAAPDDATVVCFLELGPRFLGGVTAATAADEVKGRDAGWATARRAVAVWRLRSMTGGVERFCWRREGGKRAAVGIARGDRPQMKNRYLLWVVDTQ